jgi:hypothetical protein
VLPIYPPCQHVHRCTAADLTTVPHVEFDFRIRMSSNLLQPAVPHIPRAGTASTCHTSSVCLSFSTVRVVLTSSLKAQVAATPRRAGDLLANGLERCQTNQRIPVQRHRILVSIGFNRHVLELAQGHCVFRCCNASSKTKTNA